MGTVVRHNISKKNKYYISKHRRYELEHFCRQYHEWVKEYNKLANSNYISGVSYRERVDGGDLSDKVANKAVRMADLRNYMDMVEQCARDADPELAYYILKNCTDGVTFPYMETVMRIPCSRAMFYDRLKKFYWLLSLVRT